ncbi:MAG: hypothetical protein AAF389_09490 [Gemmatimonadota bacterium]
MFGILWIMIPAPFVGYLIADSVRKVFSEDKTLLRRVFADQPVTMLAALTALGSVAVWSVSQIVMRWL